jgi:hypothetical protein
MRAKMNAQVETIRCQQDTTMKKYREAEKKVEEAGKDAGTIYETELIMIRNFYMRSEYPSPLSPSGEKPGSSGVLPAGGAVNKCRHL